MRDRLLISVFLALISAGFAGAENAVPMTICIDAAAPWVEVRPNLYGIFFEEINHDGEGGLYAETVLNRDFETVNLPAGARWAGNLLRTSQDSKERKWFANETYVCCYWRTSTRSVRFDWIANNR